MPHHPHRSSRGRRVGCALAGTLSLLATLGCTQARGVGDGVAMPNGAPALAIANVTVIDVERGIALPDRTVIVRANRIVEVAPSVSTAIPVGARLIDGRGRYLTPGFWDMHVHSAANPERDFALFLAHGITGVRNMHSTVDTALGVTNAVKRRLRSGELIGPRFIANGPILDGAGSLFTGAGAVIVRDAAQARRAVDSLARGGADFVKLYDYLTRDAFFGAMDAARARGLPVAMHVPYSVSVAEASNAGARSIEHMRGMEYDCSSVGDSVRSAVTGAIAGWAARGAKAAEQLPVRTRALQAVVDTRDEVRCRALMTLLARNGTWVVPTLGPVGDGPRIVVDDSVAMQYVPQETRARWVRMAAERRAAPPAAMGKRRSQERGNIPMLRDAGVGILAGTDTGDEFLIAGFAFHSNLEHLVFAGLSPAEALRAATLGPARFLGASDSLGTVAAGKLADLVLLDANPLVDIRNARRVRTVVANGRVFDRMALDGLLQRAARLANP